VAHTLLSISLASTKGANGGEFMFAASRSAWLVFRSHGLGCGRGKSQCDCAAAYGHWLAVDRNDIYSCVAPIEAVLVNFCKYIVGSSVEQQIGGKHVWHSHNEIHPNSIPIC
jgi:hypothetical protein